MADQRTIEERLRSVERTVSDEDGSWQERPQSVQSDRPDPDPVDAAPEGRGEQLRELDERVTELEAAVQALRGYVGNIRAVNERVERQADAAMDKADAARAAVEGADIDPKAPRPDGDDARDPGCGTDDATAPDSKTHTEPVTGETPGVGPVEFEPSTDAEPPNTDDGLLSRVRESL